MAETTEPADDILSSVPIGRIYTHWDETTGVYYCKVRTVELVEMREPAMIRAPNHPILLTKVYPGIGDV